MENYIAFPFLDELITIKNSDFIYEEIMKDGKSVAICILIDENKKIWISCNPHQNFSDNVKKSSETLEQRAIRKIYEGTGVNIQIDQIVHTSQNSKNQLKIGLPIFNKTMPI